MIICGGVAGVYLICLLLFQLKFHLLARAFWFGNSDNRDWFDFWVA